MVKMLITQKMFNCGDSFACGYGIENKQLSYPYLLSNNFDCEIESVARPGCCNYTIAKQIEYVTDKVDSEDHFVLVSTTNEDRISFPKQEKTIQGGITLNRFNYEPHTKDLLTDLPIKTTNEIQSETISNILYAETRTLMSEPNQKKQALKEYSKYVYDNGIKKDQDVFILLWKLTKLNQVTDNWLCITNYNQIHDEFPNNTLLINFGELCQKYPDAIGSGHFDEQGHESVYDKIEQWYIENKERPCYDNQR